VLTGATTRQRDTVLNRARSDTARCKWRDPSRISCEDVPCAAARNGDGRSVGTRDEYRSIERRERRHTVGCAAKIDADLIGRRPRAARADRSQACVVRARSSGGKKTTGEPGKWKNDDVRRPRSVSRFQENALNDAELRPIELDLQATDGCTKIQFTIAASDLRGRDFEWSDRSLGRQRVAMLTRRLRGGFFRTRRSDGENRWRGPRLPRDRRESEPDEWPATMAVTPGHGCHRPWSSSTFRNSHR